MGNLGTLWFGSDIDLTTLKQKIQSGNKSLMDALKMNYDPASYTQMVRDLKSKLSKETFEIKINTDIGATKTAVQNALRGSTALGGQLKLGAVDDLNAKIMRQRSLVIDLDNRVKQLYYSYQKIGGMEKRARWIDARSELANEQANLKNMLLLQQRYKEAVAQASSVKGQAAQAVRNLSAENVRLNANLGAGVHVSTQLGSALSSLYSVHMARMFLNNVIEIGGQLEKQRISIGAILGDTVKASTLFNQIKELAIKSPFGVVELDQYTKQLSAYGFQYNELYDMTKRLADISAGAGQDIGRLTLALGHVRSATYLTGITLRQFSMNNIPMLKMLADYYTELEGKIVSTAEVQKRISKRQVSYQDVIEQIKRLTDEGGMFYNMQEKISESLSSKFKNLRDALDIMYGEIAESSIGSGLKDLATNLTAATRHWKLFLSALAAGSLVFGVTRTSLLLQNVVLGKNTASAIRNELASKKLTAQKLRQAMTYRQLTAAENAELLTSGRLTANDYVKLAVGRQIEIEELAKAVALRKVTKEEMLQAIATSALSAEEKDLARSIVSTTNAIKGREIVGGKLKSLISGIGVGTWATIGATIGYALYSAYSEYIDKINERTEEVKDLIRSRIIDLEKEQKTTNETGKPQDKMGLKARVDEMKQVLANSEAYTVTLDEQLSRASSLSKQYDILVGAIKKVVEENKKSLDYQDDVNRMIKATKSEFDGWKDIPTFMVGPVNPLTIIGHQSSLKNVYDLVFNDSLSQNIEDLNESYAALRKVIDSAWEYKEALKSLVEEILNSNDASEELKDKLRNAPFEEQLRILAESGYWDVIETKISETGKSLGHSADDVNHLSEKMEKALKGVSKDWNEILTDDIPKAIDKFREERDWDEKELRKWAENNIEDVRIMLDGIIAQQNIKDPVIIRNFKRMALNYMRFGYLLDTMSAKGGDYLANILGDKNFFDGIDTPELATLKDDNYTNPKNDSKKDKQLEAAKERLNELKAFLDEYKKYSELYEKEKAIDVVEKLFPSLKGRGQEIVNNYQEELKKVLNSIPLNTTARKQWGISVNKYIGEYSLSEEKRIMKEHVDATKSYVSELTREWNLYRKLYEKSGDRDYAALAFRDVQIWDDTTREMLKKFNKEGSESGILLDTSKFNWHLTKEDAKKLFVDENGKMIENILNLYLDIQEKIRKNGEKELEKGAESINKELSEVQKLNMLLERRKELLKDIENAPDGNVRRGREAQLKGLDKEISSQQWKAFKEDNDWGRVFGDLDNMSLPTIKNMIAAMKEYADTTEMSVEETKAWYEAMEKLTDKATVLDPLKTLTETAKEFSNVLVEKKNAFKALEAAKDVLDMRQKNYDAKPSIENKVDLEEAQEIARKARESYNKALDKEASLLNKAKKAIVAFANGISELGSSLSSLGNSIGGNTGNVLSGFGSMFNSLGSGMSAIQNLKVGASGIMGALNKVSVVLSVASAMVDMNMALSKILPNSDSMYERHAAKIREINKLREAVDEYRIAVARANAEEHGWIGNDALANLRKAYDVHGDISKAYYEKLLEPQAIYKNKGSGLKKWGIPIAMAIGAVVLGVVTGGIGAVAGVAGASIGAAAGTAAAATLIAASAVVFAGVGAAAGQALGAGIDALTYRNGETAAMNNLRIQTRHKSFWRGQKTQDLQSWAKEKYRADLFDEKGLINLELAENILENYGNSLVGETKETLEKLVELRKEYDEWLQAIRDYISDAFSPLTDNMVDAIWDWLNDGKDALDSFKKYANDTFTKIAKDAVKTFVQTQILDSFEDELEELYKQYSMVNPNTGKRMLSEKELIEGVADIAGRMGLAFEELLPTIQHLTDTIVSSFDAQGYDVTGSSGNGSNLVTGQKEITEATGDLLASYVNEIRAYSAMKTEFLSKIVSELLPRSNSIAEAQVRQLEIIATNTAQTAENTVAISDIYNILLMARSVKEKGFYIQ